MTWPSPRELSAAVECSIGAWDCPSPVWQTCYPEWGQGGQGTCRCNRALGLTGAPNCDEMTEVSFILIGLMVVIAVMALSAEWKTFRYVWELHQSGKLRFDVVGRSVFFNAIPPLSILLQSIGMSLAATGRSQAGYYYYRTLSGFNHVVLSAAFVGSTSSVSLVWIEMAEKYTRVYALPTPGEEVTRGRESRGSWPYQRFLAVASVSAGALVVGSYYLLSSLAIAISFMIVFIITVGVSFHVGGRRISALLELTTNSANSGSPPAAIQRRTGTIAREIRSTAVFMSRACIAAAVSLIILSVMLPSPVPLYKAQNDLPPMLNGQFALFFSSFFVLLITLRIVDYLRFWTHGASRREVLPLDHRRDYEGSGDTQQPRYKLSTINEETLSRMALSAPPSIVEMPGGKVGSAV